MKCERGTTARRKKNLMRFYLMLYLVIHAYENSLSRQRQCQTMNDERRNRN